MQLDLATINYTVGNDLVDDIDFSFVLLVGQSANTLAGDDRIDGGRISGDNGDAPFEFGTSIYGKLLTGAGEDAIIGMGFIGLYIGSKDGAIETGDDADFVQGYGARSLIGLENHGTINTGSGGDGVFGQIFQGLEGSVGILNSTTGSIVMSDGDDLLVGEAVVGVFNDGVIDMGSGNDIVEGVSDGIMDFDGSGTINLGDDNDRIIGFGNQIVDGGAGFDKAVIKGYRTKELRYICMRDKPGEIIIESSLGQSMTYKNFEFFQIGGAEYSYKTLLAKYSTGCEFEQVRFKGG